MSIAINIVRVRVIYSFTERTQLMYLEAGIAMR